ncbi:juvenile hormone esterase-like [Amphibalanus amphitrite]|uniref:juvenile hormone esterase-like n=1 Tax=Amphibalanus amphitrite TaxID=1232801 RepID=UPI001C90E692|nr:juvenile hormone esterase-like [Amphibalanus amphitrite]XP_043225315.1 juvenile hormone esterase-like [Amphibalanus amphitrite]
MAGGLVRLLGIFAVISAASPATGPRVSTQSGQLEGTILKSFLGNNFYAFKGIPYAEPPVGDLRFRPPQPHAGWSGVRPADTFGSQCMQFAMFSSPRQLQGSEDCLFVNVYSPRLPEEDDHPQLPVMVWIHGGAFTLGSGDSDFYGPDYLMDEDVVLVTFNYRLGPFGFFTTEDASAPGNYGMHDQVLALEWVQANIAAFGGDPDTVTIFGESAGGASVGLQVLSPRSRGLFSKAISQSGASFCNFAASGDPQADNARKHAELTKCSTANSREIVGCMRQKPAEEIFNALGALLDEDPNGSGDVVYKPRVDSDSRLPFLPTDPFTALQRGAFNLVPWMTGLTQDEGSLLAMINGFHPELAKTQTGRDWKRWASLLNIQKASSDPIALAEALHRHYFGEAELSEANMIEYSNLLSDRWFTNCIMSEANLAAPHTPVYMYVLDYTGAGRQSFAAMVAGMMGKSIDLSKMGVGHSDDVLYLFRTELDTPVTWNSDKHKMIRFMVSVWTNFARRGYPSTDVLPMPSWPVYSRSRQEYMRLNTAPSVGRAPFSDRLQFWRELDIQENWRRPLSVDRHDEL